MGIQFRLLLLATLPAMLSCATPRLADVPLGSVVVYRNGVAYFERFASVQDGQISLLVAESKVDDLLKSLTVSDAKTGKTLPISFPAREAADGMVRMTVRVADAEITKVKLSYVSESPAWKPSYRLSLLADGKVELQGWAVVDNISGEDWTQVKIGVGTTSALSFRYDLWSVRDVQRQTLGHKERLATAPPTATGIATRSPRPTETQATGQSITLDTDYTNNIPIPGRSFESALSGVSGSNDYGVSFGGSSSLENQYVIDGVNTTDLSSSKPHRTAKQIEQERKRREFYLRKKQLAEAEKAKTLRRTNQLARQLLRSGHAFTIEGIASPAERHGMSVALSMANHLRNELISRNVPPSQLSVEARVGAIGEPTTLKVTPHLEQESVNEKVGSVGESKFLSRTPVTIPHRGSSMVPIVDRAAAGGVVYLYDALSLRGNDRYAFKAIRFRNPTNKFLEGGPVTVFGGDAFIGEGLTDSIAPGATAILPYALDKLVHVEREESFKDTVIGFSGVIADGAIVKKQRTSTVRYTVHNRSQQTLTVYVRHDTNRGWKLQKAPEAETVGSMSVFPIELASGEHKSLEIIESTPVTATLDLTTDDAVAAMAGFLRSHTGDSDLVRFAQSLIDAHRSISHKLKKIDNVAGQLAIYRTRVDELHAQLVTLKMVGAKGRLARNLQSRMVAMSGRAHDAIVEIVELREQIMLDRFAYRDLITSLAELAG